MAYFLVFSTKFSNFRAETLQIQAYDTQEKSRKSDEPFLQNI